MTTTVVEVELRDDVPTYVIDGELIVPRLVRRSGHSIEIALVAGRALLLPGDEVQIEVTVGAGCFLTLVDIGGLVIYGRPEVHGEQAQWHARIALGQGASLTWNGLPTVITEAGRLHRTMTMRVSGDARARVRETVVLGRTGERGGSLDMTTIVQDDHGPLLYESLHAAGSEPTPGILGVHRIMDSVLFVGDDEPLPDVPGATRLEFERRGGMLRFLGDAAHDSPVGPAMEV